MFLASSAKPIDPQLQNWVDEIEAQSPGLSVLAARQFRYRVCQFPVEVTISEPRKFNVLEEFILRAGMELNPPPTEEDLAAVLGLDSVFVENTTANLRALQTLEVASAITVTPQGRQFYQQGSVPQPPSLVQIYAVADPLVGHLTFQSNSLNEIRVDQPDLADFVTIENNIAHISSLSLAELQQLIQDSSLGLHAPESGKIVTSYSVTALMQTFWKTMSLFVVFDVLEDEVRLQVRRGKQILDSASNWLEELKVEGKVRLDALCELSDEVIAKERSATLNQKNAEVEARLEKIQQRALLTARQQRLEPQADSSPQAGTAVLLRDKEIHQAFLDTLKSAQHQILIYSPWVSRGVVDDNFLRLLQDLANRRVTILIGHGISRRQEDEERPIPPEVEEKLLAIKTPEGLPAIQVFWLGNSHAKEIIVDGKVHFCGSYNWLSRNNRLSWGETVYKVTIPNQVQEAYDFLAQRFQAHALKLWNAAMSNRDLTQAEAPLYTWGALGMEDMALNQLQQNNCLELLPVWLQVVYHRLRSGLTPQMLNTLEVALLSLSGVSEQEPNIEFLREGWCQVLGALSQLDSHAALRLLSAQAWSQFIRLGIVQIPTDSPEEFLSRCAT